MWQFMAAWEEKSCETGEPFIKSKNQVCSQSIKFKFSFQLKFCLEKTHFRHPRVVSVPAFVICCCVTNDLRLVAAWNGQRWFSGSFAAQESEGRLAGWFWLSLRRRVTMWAKVVFIATLHWGPSVHLQWFLPKTVPGGLSFLLNVD